MDEREREIRDQHRRHYPEDGCSTCETLLLLDAERAKVAAMQRSIAKHFDEEHLSGDGPEIDRWKARVAALERRLDGECETCEGSGVMTVDEGIESGHAPYDCECSECHGSGKAWIAEEMAAARAEGAAQERERIKAALMHELDSCDYEFPYLGRGDVEAVCAPPEGGR